MRSFTDTEGRAWPLSLTIGALRRVKQLVPAVDLMAIDQGEPPLIVRLCSDPLLFVDVLYALCEPQVRERGLNDEQFAAALGGQTIFAAMTALREELTDFFRGLGRSDLTAIVSRAETLVRTAVDEATTQMQTIDIEKTTRQAVGKFFTERLESSALTPIRTPSAS
jgi:hypothetical protein